MALPGLPGSCQPLAALTGFPGRARGVSTSLTAQDDPELIPCDYWSDPGTGTGTYFYAGTVEETGGYEVQHYHEGVPLEETMEARARALTRRTSI